MELCFSAYEDDIELHTSLEKFIQKTFLPTIPELKTLGGVLGSLSAWDGGNGMINPMRVAELIST